MALAGETIATGAPNTCEDCQIELKYQVLRSPAGYYVGTACKCGPYSRESGYYPTFKEADKALKNYSYWR